MQRSYLLLRKYYIGVALFVAWILYLRSWSAESWTLSIPKPPLPPHEIEQLWRKAQEIHNSRLQRQSKSVADARREYVSRYHINPPPGYDEWFAFAQERGSHIIDDFDSLMRDLQPWRSYQAARCDVQTVDLVTVIPAILTVCFRNGTVVFPPTIGEYGMKAFGNPFLTLTSSFAKSVPDLCFDYNGNDQPRALLATEQYAYDAESGLNYSCPDPSYTWTSYKHKLAWSGVTEHCPAQSAAIRKEKSPSPSQFIHSWNDMTDLCEYDSVPPHGILRSPDALLITNATRPIVSVGTLSTFQDILLPSVWRVRYNMLKYPDGTPWDEKKDSVGWRGTSTGAYAETKDGWRRFLRHRMVQLANGISVSTTATDRIESTPRLRAWLDVQFSGIVSCAESICEDIEAVLPPAEYQSLEDNSKNKIVLDMDGHGLSGRFYQLLNSNSAVLKQGLIREWHDDRILPWLHYIPLSIYGSEIETLLEYLFGKGRHVAESIAAEGRKWVNQALRREDMEIYAYRLFIEMGRREF